MCTKLGSSQAGERAIVTNVRLVFRGKKKNTGMLTPGKSPREYGQSKQCRREEEKTWLKKKGGGGSR